MSASCFDIVTLFEKKKQEDIVNYFNSIAESTFKKRLERSIQDCPHNLSTIIKAYFYGSSNETEDGKKRQQCIYEAVFEVLQKNIPSQMSTDLIGILLLHIDELCAHSLASLATKIADILKNSSVVCGRCLELLPKIIKSIAAKEEIPYRENIISGTEFKKHFLDDLCSIKWIPKNATVLATIFRDISMTLTELQFVIEKLLRLFKMIDLPEIPSFIYQLLLLSGKAKGLNQTVLQGIVTVFNTKSVDEESDLEEASHSIEEYRHIEGTAILHITYAMRQDQELAKEFVKFLKSNQHNPKNILVPFTVALGLAIIRFPSFKGPVLDLFKSAIVKHFKEMEMKKNSNWFRGMMENNIDAQVVFLDVIKNSAYGWDYVTQGLVKLGFVLLETTTTKTVGRKPADSSSAESLITQNPVANLGSTILLNVFKACDIVRSAVLEQILNQIFSKSSLANQCINLLAQIVQTSPLFVLDSVSKIQQTISCLPMMPQIIAFNLIKAIFPLLRINMPLKETIMLVLRKSLISGQIDSRKIAVKGYIHFLKNFKILGHLPASQSSQTSWSSQISADIHTNHNAEMNEVLCCELLSILVCSLSQQAEIKEIVYKGLYAVLLKNKRMTLPILELLQSQIHVYYQSKKNSHPPLKLEKVILIQNENVTLIEPLAILLMCIHNCILATNSYLDVSGEDIGDLDKIQSCIRHLESIMQSLAETMATAELEDFELDKSADYDTATSVGKKNTKLAITILLIYEVLIEYLCSNKEISSTVSERILQLYKNYKQLISILKDDNSKKTAGKEAGRPAAFKPLICLMSIENLTFLINKSLTRDSTNFACLEGTDFVRYLVLSAVQKIQEMQTEEFDSEEKNQFFLDISKLARTLCLYFDDHENEVETAENRKKIQSFKTLCLETILLITTTIANKFTGKFTEFINILQGNTNFRNSQTQVNNTFKIYEQIQIFQKFIAYIIDQDEDTRCIKDVTILGNIIFILSSYVSPDNNEQILDWVQTYITQQAFSDISVVKCFFQLFLNRLHQSKSKNSILRDVAQDIHSRLGDIDEEVQVEESKNFAIVSEQMSPTIRHLLLQHFEVILSEIDWVLNFSKADLSSLQKIDMEDEDSVITQQENRDKKICNHLGLFLTAMHELVQTALPQGLSVDALLKLLTHGYNILNLFTKYYNAMYTLKVGKCCARFEKLIKLTGTMLSPQVYALITYFQVLQNGEPEKEKKKRKLNLSVQKSKILRETRQIPPLIYGIEQFETSLMQLSKKSKINFMQHVKLGTSRDFRINVDAMLEIETSQLDVEKEDASESEVNNIQETEEEPTTKKRRLSRGRKKNSN